MRTPARLAALFGLLALTWLPRIAFSQTCAASRQELDSQARELRESIRQLENQKNRLGYSGVDLQKRNDLSSLISRQRNELSTVESLRSSTIGKPNPSTIQWQEKQVLDAETRSTREEIRLLENEKNRLGYSGDDLRRRNELNDLISRKRTVLSAEESERSSGFRDDKSQRRLARQTLDAEVRELSQEIQSLENESNRLGYGGKDLRRRNEISDLVSRKRELLSAKERQRSECR
jgi:hypothetical protein